MFESGCRQISMRNGGCAPPPQKTRDDAHLPYHAHLLVELSLRRPFWRYAEMYADGPYRFLLDSAHAENTKAEGVKENSAKENGPKRDDRLARYSFLGGEPSLVFRAKRLPGQPPEAGATIELEYPTVADGIHRPNPRIQRYTADPFVELRRLLAERRVDYAGLPDDTPPLLAGAVGYFGYEAGYFVEELPDEGRDDLDLPDAYWMFVDTLLAHCHREGRSYLSVIGRGATPAEAQRQAAALRDATLRRIEAFEQLAETTTNDPPIEIEPTNAAEDNWHNVDLSAHFSEASYCQAVETIKEHIRQGDVFEVCMTHRFEAPLLGGDAWDLYRHLRQINPAPFAAYLHFPEAQVVCSSPERFLRLGTDRVAESRPIKGTRPRGRSIDDDTRLREELATSVKDRAENTMIVDLVRNDLGRVCRYGSVQVPEFAAIEEYATVFQMVSTIRGELAERYDALDLVRAAFPGGSMTGAPKIQAMKIIDHLEPVKRGVYSGAIGYLDCSGTLDLNIVIRSILVKQDRCYLNTGGAVVADSEPKTEYQETLHKARALVAALRRLRGVSLATIHRK